MEFDNLDARPGKSLLCKFIMTLYKVSAIPGSEMILSPCSDLISTVRGRWQHMYYDPLCHNFSFAALCKSNQSIAALYDTACFQLAMHALAEPFVPSATREQSAPLHAVMIRSARNLKVRGVVRALLFVHIVDLSMSHHGGRDECGMPTQLLCLGCRCQWRLPVFAAV